MYSQDSMSTVSTLNVGLQKLMSVSSERKKASIEKEHQAVGTVSSGTYTAYLKSVHSKHLVLLFLVMQAVKMASHSVMTFSLGWWADSSLLKQHEYFIQQYGASLFLISFSSTGANILLTIIMVSASMYESYDSFVCCTRAQHFVPIFQEPSQ